MNNQNNQDNQNNIGKLADKLIIPSVNGGYENPITKKVKLAITVLTVIMVIGIMLGTYGAATAIHVASITPDRQDEETLARAQQAEDYVPQIDKEMQEFAEKKGKDSTLNMFQDTNAGKIKMEVSPSSAKGRNGTGSTGAEGSDGADGSGKTDGTAATKGDNPFQVFDGKDGVGVASKEGSKLADIRNQFAKNNFGNGGRSSFGGDNASSGNVGGNSGSDAPDLSSMQGIVGGMGGNPRSGKGGKLVASSKGGSFNHRSAERIGHRKGVKAISQAKEINQLAGSAVNAKASESRTIMDQAWEGTAVGGDAQQQIDASDLLPGDKAEMPSGEKPGYRPHGGGGRNVNPEIPEVETPTNTTPWQKEILAIQIMFTAALSLLAVAAAFGSSQIGKIVAIGIAATATAACAACVALAIVLMTKYNQKKLGGMWLALCGAGMAACAVAAIAGIAAYKGAIGGLMGTLAAHVKAIMIAVGVVGGLAGGIGGSFANNLADEDEAKKYCKEHKDSSECKIDVKTSSLPYELRGLPSDDVLQG